MPRARVRQSIALALAAVLACAGVVLADTVAADGDAVTAGSQAVVDLGAVAPGATLERDVAFDLVCTGLRHADAGQTVAVTATSMTVPLDGGLTATDGAIGPVPSTWADDTAGVAGCPSATRLAGSTPSHVTITAPSVPGDDYEFVVLYGKTLTPAGVADASSVSGTTSITFILDVVDAAPVDTTPPVFDTVPADIDVTTTDPAGLAVAFDVPTATDDQDAAPTVSCTPPSGSWFGVGSTTVSCSAVDEAGNAATTSFVVTVHLVRSSWESPVLGGRVDATRGRTVPIKVQASMDGTALRGADGSGRLLVTSCGSSEPEAVVAATWQAGPGRWMAGLDTSGLGIGCHVVTLQVGGHEVGSIRLDVTEPSAAARGASARRPS